MKKGLLITFEGVEGSGKSTQLSLLANELAKRRVGHIVTKEPGDSSFGRMVRDSLLNKKEIEISNEAEFFIFMADRADHVKKIVQPALAEGKIVLCDRYSDSTIAYQGGGRGFDLGFLETNNRIASLGVVPDITFLIDVPIEVGLKRVLKRGKGVKDRIEREQIAFHERVRKMYLRIARQDKKRVYRLDGRQDEKDLHGRILDILGSGIPAKMRKKFLGR